MNKILCLIVFICCIACDGSKEYDVYQSLNNSSWKLNDTIKFEVKIDDTITKQNVFLNVRTDANYSYSNLYIIGQVTQPNGLVLIDTLEYEMADAYGNWLGSGFTDVKDNKLYYLENYKFNNSGIYVIEFNQAMRKRGDVNGLDELKGIIDVGLRIENIQD